MSALALFRQRHAREAALAAVCAILFLTFLDNTIVSVALADIQSSLSVSVTGLQWIVDGYMLAFAALMLTGGTLGDLLGRKKVMLVGVAIFCAGSIVAALAHGSSTLIAGRIVMGLGAAASEPGTLSLIRHIYPEREERAVALGVWAAVSGLALSLGPVIGGVLISGAGWRWIFWFGVAFGAVAFAVAAVTLTESSDPWIATGDRSSGRASSTSPAALPALQRRKLDVPGLAAGAGSILAATFAVIEGENRGYGTWWIGALFAASAALIVAFVLIEQRVPDPVLKIDFLRNPTFTAANVVAFATNLSVFSVFFFTALYLQLISNFSGYQIALVFTSLAGAMIVAGPIAGRWTARVGPRVPMVLGCALAGVGLLLVDQQLTATTSVAALAWPLAIAGLGFGIALVTMTAAVLTLVPPEQSGMAASTVNTSRELGGVFGVAVLGAVVNAQLTSGLTEKLVKLGIPIQFRQIVIQFVTTGGNITNAENSPAARGHLKIVAKVLVAAENSAGHGVHLALQIAGGIVLAAAVIAAFAARHRVGRVEEVEA
ncbi:MAG TPA: MFS transporter [Gaiellaceae bacterium]|nr:MFS transporter [Gaiellaceae bacterium]